MMRHLGSSSSVRHPPGGYAMRFRTILCGAITVVFVPAMLFAQNTPLSQILPNLLLGGVTMPSTTQTVAGNPHDAHFIAALGQNQAPFAINKLVVGQLDTFPIGSSSGGFVFNFDPGTGLFKPASQSFGPGFAERALTNGRRRFGFGVNYQHLEFQSYEGTDLQNGALSFVLQHNDCCAPFPGLDDPFFEGDLVKMSLSLAVKTDVVAPFMSYGLSSRWDVGVVVPIVRVSLNPTITSTIDRIASASNPLIHSWDGLGQTTKVTTASGTATGIGDIVLRTKYRFADWAHGGLAGDVDVRLPSGDKENLLGTGAVQTKVLLIASGEFSRVAPHLNLGYTFSSGSLSSSLTTLPPSSLPANANTQSQVSSESGVALVDTKLPKEVNYVAGIDIAAHSLLTISADFVGRTELDTQRFGLVSQTYLFRTVNGGPLSSTSRDTFASTSTGSLNLLLGVVGAKFNIPGTPLLLTGSVLFPLTDAGLKAKVTPVVGLDYSFNK
jgi:hypothetical protein